MLARKWIVTLGAGLGLLTGCVRPRAETVSTETVLDALGRAREQAGEVPPPLSPYNARGKAPTVKKDEEEAQAAVTDTAPARTTSHAHNPEKLFPEGPELGPPAPETPKADPPKTIEKVSAVAPAPEVRPEDPLVGFLRCLREEKPREARKCLDALPPAQREVAAALLPLVAGLGKAAGPREVAVLLDGLDAAALALRHRATLTIERACFCRPGDDLRFGLYDPLPRGHVFHAGGDDRAGELVQVYVELRNVAATRAGSFHETDLAFALVLKDAGGNVVWQPDDKNYSKVERSRSARHDHYLNCFFHVPRKLPAGDYTLWVVVRDRAGGAGGEHRTATKSLEFKVRATE